MKRPNRRLASLCALALAVGLLLPGLAASADEPVVYQIALNDTMPDLNAETMPVLVNGVYYIPYTLFDRNVTGVNLGVSYGQRQTSSVHTFTLYTTGAMLIFDVNNGTCVDGEGNSKNMKVILHNGKVYVPLSGVCSALGLSYSFTPTSYGTLIRITNSQASLSTERFVDAAADWMRKRYNDYIKSLTVSPSPSAAAQPSPSASQPQADPQEPDKRDVRVYLAFQCTASGDLDRLLDTLDRYGVYALFFFRPEDLKAQDSAVRRIVGSGHGVGLIAPSGTAEEAVTALDEGNRLLEHIAHLRTHTVLPEDGGPDSAALAGLGWVGWEANVDGRPNGHSAAGLARAIQEEADAKRSLARITLDDSELTANALGRLLPALQEERYNIRLAVETEL